jgi:hypothetical protein
MSYTTDDRGKNTDYVFSSQFPAFASGIPKVNAAGEWMHALAHEMTTLNPEDPQRVQIVQEIMPLSELLQQT